MYFFNVIFFVFSDEEAAPYWSPNPTLGGQQSYRQDYSRSQLEQQERLIRPKNLSRDSYSASAPSKTSIETYENAPTLPRDQVKAGRHARAMQRLTDSEQHPPISDCDDNESRTSLPNPFRDQCQPNSCLPNAVLLLLFVGVILCCWIALIRFFLRV